MCLSITTLYKLGKVSIKSIKKLAYSPLFKVNWVSECDCQIGPTAHFFPSLQGDFEFLLIAYRLLAIVHFHVVLNMLLNNPRQHSVFLTSPSPAKNKKVVQKRSSVQDVAMVSSKTVLFEQCILFRCGLGVDITACNTTAGRKHKILGSASIETC